MLCVDAVWDKYTSADQSRDLVVSHSVNRLQDDVHSLSLAYARSFWSNYQSVPKYLHLGFLEGHEVTFLTSPPLSSPEL
jgi:hypothetical protein